MVRCFTLVDAGIEELPTEAPNLNALSAQLPRGAYTTFRTYHGDRVLHLSRHLDRLQESAQMEGRQITLDARLARRGLAEALARCGFSESRVRLTLAYEPAGACYIALEPFAVPPERLYRLGARCALSAPELRRHTPRAKSTSFIASAERARAAAPGVDELLLVDEAGAILEGSSSNFFAVLDGVLRTADEGVLVGTTRSLVLEVAADVLPISLQPVGTTDLDRLSEAFITSVSRLVLPVVAIAERTIGTGAPGPITQDLLQRLRLRIEAELEPVLPAS
jgi:branched-chain amino acid aminotransferase